MTDDLTSNTEYRRLVDRVRRLENTSMLQDASVSEGRLRFIGGTLRVDSGGRVEIEGTLQIDGATELTGTTQITGPLTVTGTWELEGDGEITGDVDLTGELTVAGSQPIKLHTQGGQAVITAGGGRLRGTSDGVNLDAPGGGSLFAAAGTILGAGATYGSYQVSANAGGVQLHGIPTVTGTGLPTGALLVDASGYIRKAV